MKRILPALGYLLAVAALALALTAFGQPDPTTTHSSPPPQPPHDEEII